MCVLVCVCVCVSVLCILFYASTVTLLLLVVQIIILKRLSSQQIRFDWYDQFCGGATDAETLLTMLNDVHGLLKRTAFMSSLLDEEAPVIIITV